MVGRTYGLVFFLIGVVLFGAMIVTTRYLDWGYFPKFTALAVCCAPLGLAMMIFPGGRVAPTGTPGELPDLKVVLAAAPLFHKIVWIVAGTAGLLAGLWLVTLGEDTLAQILLGDRYAPPDELDALLDGYSD